MSSNVDAWAKRMNQLAATAAASPAEIVTASARVYTNAIRAEIRGVAPSGRLRGVGKKGARVGVKYDVQTSGSGSATAIVQATGPLQLIERPTAAHSIPRTTKSRRLRTAAGRRSHKRADTGRNNDARRHLFINGEWVTGPVIRPETKGKYPFLKGVTRAETQAQIAAFQDLRKSIQRIFRG